MNRLYFLIPVFFLFFATTIVFAEEKSGDNRLEQIFQVELSPLDESPYTMDFVAMTKNSNDQLVSVINGRVYAYLPHIILEDYLNKFPSSKITSNGVDYKIWEVIISKTHEEEKAIHGSELMADWCTWLMTDTKEKIKNLTLTQNFTCEPTKDQIVIIRADHASIVVDKNDTTDYFVTVLKRLG